MLNQKTQQIIKNFLHLPFEGHDIRCPYFNNRRAGSRGALRVLVGKGNPQEIVDETELLALRDKIDLSKLSDEELTKYLVEKNLGIDCSALAYYILESMHDRPLKKILYFPHAKNPLRKLLTKLRPVENCNVTTLAHEKNSHEIKLADIETGDMIILKNAGPRHDYNHVMIVSSLKQSNVNSQLSIVNYVHSFKYPTDGLYDHGVREENILVDTTKKLVDQDWQEKKMKEYIETAQSVEIRRLKK